jgi:hypothetical protein
MKISSLNKNLTVKLGFQSIIICLAYAKLSKNAFICDQKWMDMYVNNKCYGHNYSILVIWYQEFEMLQY